MKRTVRVLQRAQSDLQEIQRYVQRDRPDAANRLVEDLLSAIESLGRFPNKGVVPRDTRLRTLRFKVVIRGEYLVFYKILPTQVRIYRILHARRRYALLI